MKPVEDFYSGLRWVGVRNVNAADAPGNAVLRVTGVAPTGEYTVDQPDADGLDGCVLNCPTLIQGTTNGGPGYGYGLATGDTPYWALYEPADGAPVAGETWGPGAGSWKLRKGKSGFLIYGGADGAKVEVMRSGGSGGGPTIDVVTNVCSAIGPDNAPAVIAGQAFAKPAAQAVAPGAVGGVGTVGGVIKGQAFSW